MLRVPLALTAAALLGLAPAAAAEPALNCHLVGIHIQIDDMNAARLVCHVTGAAGDTSFSVVSTEDAQSSPLCADGVSGGEGTCRGGVVSLDNPLSLTATLQPSGATLGPVLIGPASAPQIETPMQFFPSGD